MELYLALRKRVNLPILIEGDKALLNIYSVMEVNPANGPRINATGGKAFADFMVAPQTQNVIKSFGVEKFGQPLFVPGRRKERGRAGSVEVELIWQGIVKAIRAGLSVSMPKCGRLPGSRSRSPAARP